MKPVVLLLTCPNQTEADKIAAALLKKRLVACAKKIPVASQFWWEGKIEKAKEVLLLLETREDMVPKIESAVRPLHSHKTFVLLALPISHASPGVADWINESLEQS